MARHHFRRGMSVIWRGRRYVIERRDAAGRLQLRDLALDQDKMAQDAELIDALFAGELEILNNGAEPAGSSETGNRLHVEDLALLPEHRRKEAKRRYNYVQAVLAARVDTATKESLIPIIQRVAQETGDQCPPSWVSLYRWLRAFNNAGQDVRALIPSVTKGNRSRKFGTRKSKKTRADIERAREVARVVDDIINEAYLNRQCLSVQAVYEILEVRIAENNRFRALEDRLPIPHKNSLYGQVAKLDPYERDAARKGKRYADQRWRQNKVGVRATRPLERVEIDHTKIDLFVVDMEHRLPIGRPWVTTAIDTFSRMIIGYYISFTPPSALSVMRCLRHAIAPKSYLREKYPNVEHSWEAHGLPEEIVPDHGMEFLGRDFEDACLQLGITIDYCPVKKPWLKPMIENFFAVQNRKLLHRTPGTTFSNIFDKGDYDSSKHAVISFDALQEMIHLWLVDIYSQSEHRGLRGIPAQVWREGVAQFPPALPSSLKELHILLGQVERRKITSNGIELFGLRYNIDDLSRVRRELGKEKALIKYDANDLSVIYVADCKTYRYVSVPALDQEYTRGLTLWQHNLIRRFAHEQLKLRLDQDGLRRAKAKLQALVAQEWALTKRRSSTRVRMARYLNLNSATDGVVEKPVASAPTLENKSAVVGLLPTGDVWSGVSNIATHVVETPTTEADMPNLHLVSSMQVSATPPVKRKRRGNKGRKAAIPAVAPASDAGDKSAEVEAQAEDLDMEGWSVDFNLPR